MTKEELDQAFDKAFRRQASANAEIGGEYMDYDRRQRAYENARKVNEEIMALCEIERQMGTATK